MEVIIIIWSIVRSCKFPAIAYGYISFVFVHGLMHMILPVK